MQEDTKTKRYDYSAGMLFVFMFLMGGLFAVFMGTRELLVILTSKPYVFSYAEPPITGQSGVLAGLGIVGFLYFWAVMAAVFLRQEFQSTKAIYIDDRKIELPLTIARKKKSDILFSEILSTKIKKSNEGDTLVIRTSTATFSIEAGNFASKAAFQDFCETIEQRR